MADNSSLVHWFGFPASICYMNERLSPQPVFGFHMESGLIRQSESCHPSFSHRDQNIILLPLTNCIMAILLEVKLGTS